MIGALRTLRSLGSLKSLKDLRAVGGGGYKSGRDDCSSSLIALTALRSLGSLKTFWSADGTNSAVCPRSLFGESAKYGMYLHEIRREFPKKRSAAVRKYYSKLIRT